MSLGGGISGLVVHLGLQYGMRDDLAPEGKRMGEEPKRFLTLRIAHIPLSHHHAETPCGGDVYGHAAEKKLVAAVLFVTFVPRSLMVNCGIDFQCIGPPK